MLANPIVDHDQKPRRSAPLTQGRIDMLNMLGFTWTIRSRDSLGESWNQRFEELKQYKEENGHCLVPSRYPPNPELGIWVGTQRYVILLVCSWVTFEPHSICGTFLTPLYFSLSI